MKVDLSVKVNGRLFTIKQGKKQSKSFVTTIGVKNDGRSVPQKGGRPSAIGQGRRPIGLGENPNRGFSYIFL